LNTSSRRQRPAYFRWFCLCCRNLLQGITACYQYNITWNSLRITVYKYRSLPTSMPELLKSNYESPRAHQWDGEISVVLVQNLSLGVSNLSVCNLESRPRENPQQEAQTMEKSYRFCVHSHKNSYQASWILTNQNRNKNFAMYKIMLAKMLNPI
jgi:hypothetical protein